MTVPPDPDSAFRVYFQAVRPDPWPTHPPRRGHGRSTLAVVASLALVLGLAVAPTLPTQPATNSAATTLEKPVAKRIALKRP